MTHRTAQSERTGLARDAQGGLRQTYRALRPLPCAGCGNLIPTGAVFMRRGPITHTGYSTTRPHCPTCMPFHKPPPPHKEHQP